MDHHCVWINNCFGAGNAKFFFQFLWLARVYISTYIIAVLIGLLASLGYIGNRKLVDFSNLNSQEIVATNL